MAKKPLQHKIDDAAKLIFKSIFNEISWNVELQPDYGIDFRVQLLDPHNNISPDVFLAQLKGHEECKWIRKKHRKGFSQPLSVERLIDYLEAYKEPVYLVVIDTTNKLARYIFMQNYSDSGLLSSDWRSQETVNIFVPAENDLQNQTKFKKDLDAATQYLCNKYPGSPNAAIQHATKRYQQIDPRFEVKWEPSGNTVAPHFISREPINLKLKLNPKGNDADERVKRLFQTGLPTEFSCNEVQFEGSPLFEQINTEEKLTIQLGLTRKIFISFKRLDKDGREVARLDGLVGHLTSGKEQYHFHAELPGGLLVMNADNISPNKTPSTFTLKFQISSWAGSSVQKLPYFAQLYSLFGEKDPLEIQFSILLADTGAVLACATSNINQELMKRLSSTLQLTWKLRRIAEMLQIQPLLKETLTEADIHDINRVFTILTKGKLTTDSSKGVLTLNTSKKGLTKLLEIKKPDCLSVTNDECIKFFENPILIGKCNHQFSQVYFRNRDELLARLDKLQDSDEISFEMEGTKDCLLTETIKTDSPLLLKAESNLLSPS